jgi:hypothetical protein
VRTPVKVPLVFVGLAIAYFGVDELADATQSRHQHQPRNSRMELIVHARQKNAEPTQTLAEMVEAQLLACRLEVNSDYVGDIAALDDGHFRAVLRPALDDTNRRQFRGCLEDWVVDGVRIDVKRLSRIETRTD